MKGSRGFRIIFGVVTLVVFAAYFIIRYNVSPKSSDFDSDHAFIYSEVQEVIESGGDLIEYFKSNPKYAYLLDGTDAAAAQTEAAVDVTPAVEATPEPTVDPNSPAGRAAALGLPTPPEIDLTSWEFVLVNGDNSIDQYEPPELAYLNQTADEQDIQTAYNANRCPVDSRIAQALLDFALGCKEAGLPVYLSSGYRSYTDQQANFTRVCNNNGVTDGKDANGHYITMPAGCSEHQTGLSCDITDRYREIKNSEIENTDTYKWLLENCAQYGFIHRFPSGKEDVTGVMYEPFHFRYVGVEAATYIEENGICFEEFIALYTGDTPAAYSAAESDAA